MDNRKFPPREGDLPREELARKANRAVLEGREMGLDVSAFFNFTCPECGARCSLNDANTLYEEGECCQCGHISKIEVGGFSLHIKPQKENE